MNDLRERNAVQEAPNYLNANIAMFGVNLTWILFVVWAAMGFAAVLVTGALINCMITVLHARLTQEPQPPRWRLPE